MRPITAFLVLAAAGCGLGGCGSAALQTAKPPRNFTPATSTVIYSCGGAAQVRPRAITLFCGDDGAFVSRIRWSQWGTATASGRGRDVVNLCNPDCAAGHDTSETVALTATGLSLDGTSASYTSLTIDGAKAGISHFTLTINGPVLK